MSLEGSENKASGRTLFGRYRVFVRGAYIFYKLVPKPLQYFIWDLSRPFAGRLALLTRYALLKVWAKEVGDNVYVGRNVLLRNPEFIEIGENVSLHDGCYIDAIGGCKIGSNVSIAHYSSIVTFDHMWIDEGAPIKYNPIEKRSVEIGNDVWIGAGCRILSGSSIGSRVIVAAGAVVTKSIPSRAVCGGVPAKIIKLI